MPHSAGFGPGLQIRMRGAATQSGFRDHREGTLHLRSLRPSALGFVAPEQGAQMRSARPPLARSADAPQPCTTGPCGNLPHRHPEPTGHNGVCGQWTAPLEHNARSKATWVGIQSPARGRPTKQSEDEENDNGNHGGGSDHFDGGRSQCMGNDPQAARQRLLEYFHQKGMEQGMQMKSCMRQTKRREQK